MPFCVCVATDRNSLIPSNTWTVCMHSAVSISYTIIMKCYSSISLINLSKVTITSVYFVNCSTDRHGGAVSGMVKEQICITHRNDVCSIQIGYSDGMSVHLRQRRTTILLYTYSTLHQTSWILRFEQVYQRCYKATSD